MDRIIKLLKGSNPVEINFRCALAWVDLSIQKFQVPSCPVRFRELSCSITRLTIPFLGSKFRRKLSGAEV